MSLKEFKKNGEFLNGFHRVRSKKSNCSGTFKNGKLNGKGKCEFFRKIKKSDITDPSIMDGKWVDNKLVKGKKVYPYYSKKSKKIHNQIHIGSFKNGKLDGKGEKKWHNVTEKGIYKNGKLNGNCITKWNNGVLQKGLCKNDSLVKGKKIKVYHSKNTKKMEKAIEIGTFKNGKLNGKCVKKWRNATYRGLCKNGIKHGEGTYIFEGKKLTGIWRRDKLIEPQNWWDKISSYLQKFTRSNVSILDSNAR
jgi:hypothetical protein